MLAGEHSRAHVMLSSQLTMTEARGMRKKKARKSGKRKAPLKRKRKSTFAVAVGLALRRAAKEARRVARMHGTPIYVWENGRVVAIKP